MATESGIKNIANIFPLGVTGTTSPYPTGLVEQQQGGSNQ